MLEPITVKVWHEQQRYLTDRLRALKQFRGYSCARKNRIRIKQQIAETVNQLRRLHKHRPI